MKGTHCTIGIFAREPIAGATKTRLIPLLGAQGAADFHKRCVQAAVHTAQQAQLGEVTLYVTPALIENSFFSTLDNLPNCAPPKCVLQTGADLGTRMHAAFVHGLAGANTYTNTQVQRMIIIGTDCLALTVVHLTAVDEFLSNNKGACFIPAEDGGYVLVALSEPCAALFAGIDWGTEHVMQQTRDAAKRAGIALHEMPVLWDIDTPADYQRLVEGALFSGVLER